MSVDSESVLPLMRCMTASAHSCALVVLVSSSTGNVSAARDVAALAG